MAIAIYAEGTEREQDIMAQTITTADGTEIYVDGKHKHGGATYAIRTNNKRVALGVLAKMPKLYIEKYGKDRSYMVNDWTTKWIDGVEPVSVFIFPTRAKAVLKLISIGEASILAATSELVAA